MKITKNNIAQIMQMLQNTKREFSNRITVNQICFTLLDFRNEKTDLN